MEPIKSVSEAKRAIESYQGAPEEFALAISDELQDPLGMNMAIIGDHYDVIRLQPELVEVEHDFTSVAGLG